MLSIEHCVGVAFGMILLRATFWLVVFLHRRHAHCVEDMRQQIAETGQFHNTELKQEEPDKELVALSRAIWMHTRRIAHCQSRGWDQLGPESYYCRENMVTNREQLWLEFASLMADKLKEELGRGAYSRLRPEDLQERTLQKYLDLSFHWDKILPIPVKEIDLEETF